MSRVIIELTHFIFHLTTYRLVEPTQYG